MHWLDLSVLILYVGLLLFFGFYRTKQSGKDPEEYLLAGRKLSLPGFVVTLVATWYGGILGIGENTYSYGIQTWFIFGFPYYIFAFLFAFFIAGKINRLKTISLPDQFHKQYGKTAGVVSALFILALASPAPYILSIGILLQFTTGLSLGLSLIIATGLSLSYIWVGGFKAVIRTDIFQFGFMFMGFLLLLIFSMKSGGPISEFSLPETHLDITGGASIQYMLVWFFIALWTFVDPGFYQRCAAAKSPEIAKKGILISIGFWFIFDMLTLSTGLYAKALLTGGDPLFAYPRLGAMVLPPLAYGIFITGLLATIMSTIDSLGLISAITFGRDILWRIQSPTTKDQQLWNNESTQYVRKGLGVTAFIALGLAFSVPSVVNLWYGLGSILVPGLVLPFLLSFKNDRPRSGIVMMMVYPVFVGILWMVLGKFLNGYPLGLEPFYPGILTSGLIYVIKVKN
ncbi:MAG: sodium:solute symporter family protein [Candidatus Marinimicrobia bacterium]|jgi:SSS family solute:Na+ symporter|nr:sodium:solute symporter family protein [Candidatus Neomarinimicrobiota bacterium]MBT3676507.1 sodium:solute symporter family protein [Candidatus Neomarinimicrobiota bacterium]MBT4067744.1 sodium:solute symporter family protein [Candidatus Neomarinimicrobiota bacterium]MBT4271112.1 sodium:solute symporter family protein [Candidatus Neomarinimicrobiota bacterium]MBT4372147.1 sodium:solute symporter family protein [Candidatus Neomarinimicrobiota bacterium]